MKELIIGNKNYSSWSLRPWLLMVEAGLEFRETRIPLYTEAGTARLRRLSPSATVPVLVDQDLKIHDSLAICEYLHDAGLVRAWPDDRRHRALARAVVSEMHSGFFAVRSELPMNCRRRYGRFPLSPAAAREVERLQQILAGCLEQNPAAGPWLFGTFSVADCFFAPVLLRFCTYGIPLTGAAGDWGSALLALPGMERWLAEAAGETEVIAACEFDRE